MVLAGGLGTRLRPLTAGRPKQMLPVVDRPMIEHVAGKLAAEGVSNVVLSLGYQPDELLARYSEGLCAGVRLYYATEATPLGTAGGLLFAARSSALRELAGDFSETFMVVNGDILTDASFADLVSQHYASAAAATILTIPVKDASRFGSVLADETGKVQSFVEKPSGASPAGGWINAGVYVLEPEILDLIEVGRPVSMERDIFPLLAREGSLYAFGTREYWIDAGTPRSYLQAQLDLISGRRREVLRAHSEQSRVSPDAEVVHSVVMARAEVKAGASLLRSVVLPGGRVCSGALVADSVVGFDAVVEAGAVLAGHRLLADGERVAA